MSPFTLVVCRADGCTGHPGDHPTDPVAGRTPAAAVPVPAGRDGIPNPVVQALSDATRHTEHGVLVVTGCLLGMLCHVCGPSAADSSGRVVVVQPCHRSREPSGPAVLVGPIRDPGDTDALCRWLRSGALTAGRLPDRLRGYERTLRRGSPN